MKKAGGTTTALKLTLGAKIMVFTFLLMAGTVLIFAFFSYRAIYVDLEKAMGERLEAIAVTGALLMDSDLHEQIQDSTDVGSAAYKTLRRTLEDIKEKNRLTGKVYTLRFREKSLRYVVMADEEKPLTGQIMRIPPEMRPALYEGKQCRSKIYYRQKKPQLSAYAPFFAPDGQASGILALDITLAAFPQERQEKNKHLVFICIALLLGGFLLSYLISRTLLKNLKYLTHITEKISTGLAEQTIKVNSQDELGQLAESFKRMQTSLKMAVQMIENPEEENVE